MKLGTNSRTKIAIGVVALLNLVNIVSPVSFGALISEASSPTVSLANVSFSRGDLVRISMMGIDCAEVDGNGDGEADNSLEEYYDDSMEGEFGNIEGYIHEYCIDEDYTGLDPAGPLQLEYEVSYESRATRLPAGWAVCENSIAYSSFEKQAEWGLVPNVGSDDSNTRLGYIGFWGDGGPVSSTALYAQGGGYTLPTNPNRMVITPKILVCGPDSSTPSGIGWRYLVGKPMTLPPISKWPKSN